MNIFLIIIICFLSSWSESAQTNQFQSKQLNRINTTNIYHNDDGSDERFLVQSDQFDRIDSIELFQSKSVQSSQIQSDQLNRLNAFESIASIDLFEK